MKIRLLVPVMGTIGPYDCPSDGDILELPPALATAWADGERAVFVDKDEKKRPKETATSASSGRETAAVEPPERGVPPAGRPKRPGQ